MKCNFCNKKSLSSFIDLGLAPPSNDLAMCADEKKIYYPLNAYVCKNCKLVQLGYFVNEKNIFNESYPYFSSSSTSWLSHAKKYSETIISELKLNSNSQVIEIASNDGYLLKNFKSKNIKCLGIEPTQNTANFSIKHYKINVIKDFFSSRLSKYIVDKFGKFDLIIGNNVFAHVPDIKDFTNGLKLILSKNGTINLEFPHLLNLVKKKQFDSIYHEHYSYLSLYSVIQIFKRYKLRVYKVLKLKTHGGSLRVYACHEKSDIKNDISLNRILNEELNQGVDKLKFYKNFQFEAEKIKNSFISFLLLCHKKNKKVCGYGAAAKASTLLNFSGVKSDLLPFISDVSASKVNKFIPGCNIPIKSIEFLLNFKPDFIIIFPWNIKEEIFNSLSKKKALINTTFVVFTPKKYLFI